MVAVTGVEPAPQIVFWKAQSWTMGPRPEPWGRVVGLSHRGGRVSNNLLFCASLLLSFKVCPILHHQYEPLLSYSYPEPIQ